MRIRTRLLAVSLMTLAAGLAVLLVLGNILFVRTTDGQIARLLASRADAQIAALDVRPAGVSIRRIHNDAALDGHAWIFDRRGLLERPPDLPAAVDRLAVAEGSIPGPGRVRSVGGYRVESVPLFAGARHHQVGAVVVELATAPFESLKRTVLVGSLAFAGILLVVLGIAVDRALRGALDPVRRMTEAAAQWSEHDLERRFGLDRAVDEIGGLALTLDRLLDRIAASRRHERRFATDVAHELRTPLAAIRGRAELSLDPRAPGNLPAALAAIEAIDRQAIRMTETVDTLLAVARAETDPETGRVDLASIARSFDGVQVRPQSEVTLAEGEPEVVRRALAPLVENALRHARSDVVIELASHDGRSSATVRDDGPGLDPRLGDLAFEPGRRGHDEPPGGAGLGLALARRLARACGGDVITGSGPGGCFTLELPALGGTPEPPTPGSRAVSAEARVRRRPEPRRSR
jgi:two-component system, OmpR family, sensor kinase